MLMVTLMAAMVISGDGKNDMVMVMILVVGLVTFKVKVVT